MLVQQERSKRARGEVRALDELNFQRLMARVAATLDKGEAGRTCLVQSFVTPALSMRLMASVTMVRVHSNSCRHQSSAVRVGAGGVYWVYMRGGAGRFRVAEGYEDRQADRRSDDDSCDGADTARTDAENCTVPEAGARVLAPSNTHPLERQRE